MESNKPDKETILKYHYGVIADEGDKRAIFAAMEFFSASQNSELKKIIKQMTEDFAVKIQELKKENEELKERVINLQQADMTHEYNNAEAERVWPQIEEQIREDERQKLQSTIEEKDKEIALLNETIVNQHNLILSAERRALGKAAEELQKQCAEKDKEIERLKGLIEDAYICGSSCATKILMIGAGNDNYENNKAKSWQQFKTENQL